MKLVHANDLPWAPSLQRGAYHQRHKALGDGRLRASLYELAPGKKSFPFHAHALTEEALYVLSGRAQVRSPDGLTPIGPGDYVAFPAGGPAHQLVNDGADPLVYLGLVGLAGVRPGGLPGHRQGRGGGRGRRPPAGASSSASTSRLTTSRVTRTRDRGPGPTTLADRRRVPIKDGWPPSAPAGCRGRSSPWSSPSRRAAPGAWRSTVSATRSTSAAATTGPTRTAAARAATARSARPSEDECHAPVPPGGRQGQAGPRRPGTPRRLHEGELRRRGRGGAARPAAGADAAHRRRPPLGWAPGPRAAAGPDPAGRAGRRPARRPTASSRLTATAGPSSWAPAPPGVPGLAPGRRRSPLSRRGASPRRARSPHTAAASTGRRGATGVHDRLASSGPGGAALGTARRGRADGGHSIRSRSRLPAAGAAP